uniref:Autophagy-related protein 9 n=1 Tax=Kwoniella dejecticola CBS 10117 TaxID=1296121 RepID=A0A1A6A260_9TREE|nr:autophagy-like protein 9 [Kwoniella dejecticola CBS 10117]OBR84114.1 autophagy-like protein 9 [Kwoniella dejecticola CBS 10117]
MTSPSQRSNPLLNLINPYSSVARSTYPDPDSPSTMLLRELQGGDDLPEEEEFRDRMSPTPTPSSQRGGTHIIATSSSSSDDEGAPPRSLIFGEQPEAQARLGDRTPTSPPRSGRIKQHAVIANNKHISLNDDDGETPIIPRRNSGPFRAASDGPSSSTSQSRSRSTSPGPSTISIYASGLELEGTNVNLGSSIRHEAKQRDPSTSPEPDRQTRPVPTFREPPRPTPPRRVSGSSRKSPPRLSAGSGYLDPNLPSPSIIRDKGKGKAKSRDKAGRKYHALPAQDEEDEQEEDRGRYDGVGKRMGKVGKIGLNGYEKALWKWVNVEDLDGFLQEVYDYYKGKGIWCIALARALNLLTSFFVIAFSTFLTSCIDYKRLWSEVSGPDAIARLDDVLVEKCITRASFPHIVFMIIVTAFFVFQLSSFVLSLPKLLDMYRFYTFLLGIPDADIQTLPWPEIVRLIGEIRKHNPVTSLSNGQTTALAEMVDEADQATYKKLDAHDVANRILRQENYLIALFNKDLLDLRVRLPRTRQFISFGANTLTKALEWNLRFCLMGYLFDARGQVKKEFVRERRRKDLVLGLKTRFIFMGVLNAIFAPFIVVYLLMYSFFRYFEEYHKNPSSIGGRQYTPYAQWKFREFNELPHLFERRLDRSYPIAKEFIDQFPKERTALIMRFVAFIAGSFAAVLLLASVIDPDLFLHFEITPHRTVLFYLGLFGGILAVARGMVPEDNFVFDPEERMKEVVRFTHYLPEEWKGKLHSQMVHQSFGQLFALKITIFFTELLSVILTPFVLFFSLPPCAGAIIDFFREFTVHVDGVGYVCSFAVFDFRRNGSDPKAVDEVDSTTATAIAADDTGPAGGKANNGTGITARWREKGNEKMESSVLHFKATHPDWVPSDPSASIFLDRLVGQHSILRSPRSPKINRYDGQGQGQRPPQAPSASIYAGGRGLGLGLAMGAGAGAGMDEGKLKERKNEYERAWDRSSHLIKPKAKRHSSRDRDRDRDRDKDVIQEGEEGGLDTNGGDDDGLEEWKESKEHTMNRGERQGEGSNGEGWKDEGMRGILQQVLGR